MQRCWLLAAGLASGKANAVPVGWCAREQGTGACSNRVCCHRLLLSMRGPAVHAGWARMLSCAISHATKLLLHPPGSHTPTPARKRPHLARESGAGTIRRQLSFRRASCCSFRGCRCRRKDQQRHEEAKKWSAHCEFSVRECLLRARLRALAAEWDTSCCSDLLDSAAHALGKPQLAVRKSLIRFEGELRAQLRPGPASGASGAKAAVSLPCRLCSLNTGALDDFGPT